MIIPGHVYAASTSRKYEHILPTGRPNERNDERNEQLGRVYADSMALKLDGRMGPRAERKLDNGSNTVLR